MRWLLLLVLASYPVPLTSYQQQHFQGWQIFLHDAYLKPKNRILSLQVRRVLQVQLSACTHVLPKHAIQKLRATRIFVEYDANPMCRGNSGVYRTGTPRYVWQRGLHPLKANAIELCGAKIFYDTVHTMPAQLLHELAHAYHAHHVTPLEEQLIQTAYTHAKSKGLYVQVPHYGSRPRMSYARLNVREYFAETTESFFGRNNAFPFDRKQLKTYDPLGYKMVRIIWKVQREPPMYPVQFGYTSYIKGFSKVKASLWK